MFKNVNINIFYFFKKKSWGGGTGDWLAASTRSRGYQ
jgi:hypothetical protein